MRSPMLAHRFIEHCCVVNRAWAAIALHAAKRGRFINGLATLRDLLPRLCVPLCSDTFCRYDLVGHCAAIAETSFGWLA